MKRRSTLALLSLLLFSLLLLSHAALAQQPSVRTTEASESARAAEERRAELERKAVALLQEAVAEAQGLKLFENRVRAQTLAANLLWTRDEQAARALYKAAAEGLASQAAALDPEDPQLYMAAQSLTQLRSELIQSLSNLDAQLALEYLRLTRPPRVEALRSAGYSNEAQEQQLEMSLASRVAAKDPKRALRMAEQSLARGATSSHVSVVQELRSKDAAAASRLAAEIVKRLRPEDLTANHESSAAAAQLLSIDPQDSRASQQAAAGPAPVVDARTRAELVEKILAAVMSNAQNQSGTYNLYNALQTLLPEMEKTNPARAESLRRKSAELERSFNPQAEAWRPYRQLAESGTAEAMLEAAPKAPAEVRDHLYTQAAWKLFNEGDPERARQIIENISNPQQRGQMRRSFDMQTQWRAAQQGRFAEALAAVTKLSTVEEKVASLMQIATLASAKGETQTARQALDEARGLTEGQPAGQPQFRARLQLAAAYARVDTGEAFEMVEASIARLNELLDAAASLEGFGQDSFKEGELRPLYGYGWNDLINQCSSTLASLAAEDFERASAGAKSFRRADVRASAQLHLVQALLGALSRGHMQMRRGSPVVISTGGGIGGEFE